MNSAPAVTVRPVAPDDLAFLWEMLYRASWSHLDPDSTPESIRDDPALAQYLDGWGRPGDLGVIALDGTRPRGAAWVRLLADDESGSADHEHDVPELAIAVSEGHEGRGIGSSLLDALMRRLPDTSVVLTARSTNPAIALYERHGFVPVGTITNRVGTTSVKMLRTPPEQRRRA